ncbi:hypothetical protein AB3N59_05660 [Leptospira sp. WS92.C1]
MSDRYEVNKLGIYRELNVFELKHNLLTRVESATFAQAKGTPESPEVLGRALSGVCG